MLLRWRSFVRSYTETAILISTPPKRTPTLIQSIVSDLITRPEVGGVQIGAMPLHHRHVTTVVVALIGKDYRLRYRKCNNLFAVAFRLVDRMNAEITVDGDKLSSATEGDRGWLPPWGMGGTWLTYVLPVNEGSIGGDAGLFENPLITLRCLTAAAVAASVLVCQHGRSNRNSST